MKSDVRRHHSLPAMTTAFTPHTSLNRAILMVATVCLSASALLSLSCDTGDTINYENDTDELLVVQLNGGSRNQLAAHSTSNVGYLSGEFRGLDGPLTIVIADERGCIVLRLDTTLRRFRDDHDLALTIAPADLPPLEERTNCDPNLAD